MNLFFQKKQFKYEFLAVALIVTISRVYFVHGGNNSLFLLIASILGIYMAMNIGANDIANNMGPAVGSKALSLTGAIIIAIIAEASGAMIAGGDVVDTIKGGIINPAIIQDSKVFGTIMMSTLVGAAIWINLATILKAPVSATHSVIGGLMGAGITAAGLKIVTWSKVGSIVLSWIISPLMGGVIAVIFMIAIRKTIIVKQHRGDAAKKWVPIFVGIMAGIFCIYLLLKGLKPLVKSNPTFSNIINTNSVIYAGYMIGLFTYGFVSFYYQTKLSLFKNSKKFINQLFNLPLIFAVGLLSFAHGANDVANAIGPLAAINDIIQSGNISVKNIGIPLWVMALGAIGLTLGLAIFGARLIKTVGNEITKLNQMSAFSVALSAAITVIIASGLGLPVSSTHIAIGGIFGIGLLKEHRKRLQGKTKDYIQKSMIKSIILAWIITLPMSGLISSLGYLIIIRFV